MNYTFLVNVVCIEKRLNFGVGDHWSVKAAQDEAESILFRIRMAGKLKLDLKPMTQQDIEARARYLACKYKCRQEYVVSRREWKVLMGQSKTRPG